MNAAAPPLAGELDAFACPLAGIQLIEASAGTGKTWNICALYLRLLLEHGLEPRRILVVTFTNAATAELRQRLRERLRAALEALQRQGTPQDGDEFTRRLLLRLSALPGWDPAAARHRLEAALTAFDEAAIHTIHGFCQRALADAPFAAGQPFALEVVADDADLRREAVADFWRRHVAGDGLPAPLAAWLAQRRDSPETWSRLLARRLGRPLAREIWPDGLPDPLATLDDAHDPAPLLQRLQAVWNQARALWQTEGEAIRQQLLEHSPGNLHGASYKPETIATAARGWAQALRQPEPTLPDGETRPHLFSADYMAEKKTKTGVVPEHPFHALAAELLATRATAEDRLDAARLGLLRRMLRDTAADLARKKHSRRLLGFDDMLGNLHDALLVRPQPGLAQALRTRYPAALIDEFQDTDPLQFAIFQHLYGTPEPGRPAPPLFLVGDPKQAIYSFRGADLHAYLHARDQAAERHTLRHNQRSVAGLIAAGNRLFQANPRAFVLPGLDYETVGKGQKPVPPLWDDAAGPGPDPAPFRIWRLPRQADGGHPERGAALEQATRATAAEIARLLRQGRAGGLRIGDRPVRPEDLAVLVRTSAQGTRIKQALATLGIGSVELTQDSVFASPDAEELERVLLAILEPGRRPRLLAALATQALGWDAPALAGLGDDDGELSRRTEAFAAYRDTWRRRGFSVMARQWLEQEAVSRRLLARPDGERRLTNLLHLLELLHQAAARHPAPEDLARWLAAQRRDDNAGETAQLRLESDRALVRIVTVHKAKGLEFPIVFCPYLFDGHRKPEDKDELLEYHDDAGRQVADFRPRAGEDEAIKARRDQERQAESLRLIYVALTRAVHRCYLVAGLYHTVHGRNRSPSLKQAGRAPLNWLVAGDGHTPEQWLTHDPDPDAIEAAWAGLTRHDPGMDDGALSLEDLPATPGQPLDDDRPAPDRLRLATPPGRPLRARRIGSYSGLLARDGGDPATEALAGPDDPTADYAALDHDAHASLAPAPETPTPPPVSLPLDDILRFPRGAEAGECIHAVFEQADFTDPATWPAAIDAALSRHPPPPDAAEPARLGAMLHRMLADVLSTPLTDTLRLDAVPRQRRLTELAFHFPVANLDMARLHHTLARLGYPPPPLHTAPLDGYLKGYIDLVFEADGRYYLLDWKSNHLGERPGDYRPENLERAMAEHGYALQFLLYSLALHRHLTLQLPGYHPERHFGGVFYLFVRGVRPGWRHADRPTGVYFHRPAPATLARLDTLMRGAGPLHEAEPT